MSCFVQFSFSLVQKTANNHTGGAGAQEVWHDSMSRWILSWSTYQSPNTFCILLNFKDRCWPAGQAHILDSVKTVHLQLTSSVTSSVTSSGFSATFDVLSEAHGWGDRLALAVVALLLEDVVVAGHVVHAQLFPPLLLLVSGRQLLREGEHGEDDQQHGHGTQQEPAPPGDRPRGRLKWNDTGKTTKAPSRGESDYQRSSVWTHFYLCASLLCT